MLTPRRALLRGLPVALALLPLVFLVYIAIRLSVDVPFWDEWEFVPRLQKLYAGTIGLDDVWRQHNEHRPMFPLIWMLALARLTRWNTHYNVATTLTCGVGIFLVFGRFVQRGWRTEGGAPLWLLPLASMFIFSPFQWENWLWGWQITALMGTLAAIAGLYLLSTETIPSGWRFAAALACGIWSTYSFASGLVYWVAGPVAIVILGGRSMAIRLLGWVAIGGLTLASYFYDYHAPGNVPVVPLVQKLGMLVLYSLKYIGAPAAAYSGVLAALAGAAAIAAFGFLAFRLWGRRRDAAFLFPFVLGVQTLGVAMASAIGRASFGSNQALASRYGTISGLMWCALAALAVLWLRTGAAPRWRPAVVVASILVLASTLHNGSEALALAAARSHNLEIGRRGLIGGHSDALLLLLYPDLSTIKERRVILQKLGTSVFRP